MGETVASNAACEESVSFGKFEKDSSLSWEKWSTFSPNKYLEEVGKCATFGSVAQKKAYFESHYKRSTIQKAEHLSSQEKRIENDLVSSREGNSNKMIGYSYEAQPDIDAPKDIKWDEKVESDNNLPEDVSNFDLKEQFEDDQCITNNQTSQIEGLKGEPDMTMTVQLDDVNTNRPKEDALPNEGQEKNLPQTPDVKVCVDVKGLQSNDKNERGSVSKSKEKIVSSDLRKKPQKINPANNERDVPKTKKKPEGAAVTLPQTLTSRKPKPILGSTAASIVKSSTTHVNGSPSQRNKNLSAGESKKVPLKSLHMSINLGSKSSYAASPIPTRKSLIMEHMAHKDIVKRAFKTFQNNVPFVPTRSFQQEKSSETKRVTSVVADRTSTSMTDGKEHGRSCRARVEKTGSKASPLSSSLRNDEKAEKRKEFKEMVKEKSNVKGTEKAHLQSKAEEKRAKESEKQRQTTNFRAKPLPAFYREQNKSNPYSRKIAARFLFPELKESSLEQRGKKVYGTKSVDGQLPTRERLNFL